MCPTITEKHFTSRKNKEKILFQTTPPLFLRQNCKKLVLTDAGVEPTIFGFEVQRLAIGPAGLIIV
jgi:hypothetical protein